MKIANFFLQNKMHACHWQSSNETVTVRVLPELQGVDHFIRVNL